MTREPSTDLAHAESPANTSALISRAKGGDHAATKQLLNRFADFARAAVRRRMGHALAVQEGIDDLVRSCIGEALESFPAYRKIDGVSVFGWLSTIIDRKLHAKRVFHRALKRTPAGTLLNGSAAEGAIEVTHARVRSPVEAAEVNEAVGRLRIVMSRFEEEERTLVMARFDLGLAWDEIGDIFECGADTARIRCTRLLRRIREAYGANSGTPYG